MKYAVTVRPPRSSFYINSVNVDLHYFSPYEHLLAIMEMLSYSEDFTLDILIFWYDKSQVWDDYTGYTDVEQEFVETFKINSKYEFDELHNKIKQDKNYLKNLF